MDRRFVDHRARVKRLCDGEATYGWVTYATTREVYLAPTGLAIPSPGDAVEIVVEAEGAVSTVQAVFVRTGPDGLEFKATTDWRSVASEANHRRRLYGGFCYWIDGEQEVSLEMTDLSRGGFGFVSHVELPEQETLVFGFVSRRGEMRIHGQVAHIVQAQENLFRGGVQMSPQTRLESANWQSLVREAA